MRLVDYYVKNSELFPVSPMLNALPGYLGMPGIQEYNGKDCLRYCGAGHEMVCIERNGEEYPCHRFLPWITGKPAPSGPINRQTQWMPEDCSKCKIVSSCPTCAGYNWEINGDSSIRTTFHCEAHKLQVLAAGKIALKRLKQKPLSYFKSLSVFERKTIDSKAQSLLELINNGI